MTNGQISTNEHKTKSWLQPKETLPPKKRFGQYYEAPNKTESEKMEKKSTILPGVIRHTSCPDHSLAYFFG